MLLLLLYTQDCKHNFACGDIVVAAAFIQIKRALKLYTCWKATQKSEQCLYSLYITVKLQTNIQLNGPIHRYELEQGRYSL